MQLDFDISFSNLYNRNKLLKLDKIFLSCLKLHNKNLFCSLDKIRKKTLDIYKKIRLDSSYKMMDTNNSKLIIDLSYFLDEFITKLFKIEEEIKKLKKKHSDFVLIYKCKRLFVQRYALKKYSNISEIDINYVINKLSIFFTLPIKETDFAKQIMFWFDNKQEYYKEIELAAKYAVWKVKSGCDSILFSTCKKLDYKNLLSFSKKNIDDVEIFYSKNIKRRYGFNLTSEKLTLNKALNNVHYCIFCHKQGKDSCSKGLKESFSIIDFNNKFKEHMGCNDKLHQKKFFFKKSPLKIELHGCPLEQKISEMNLVKSNGYSIGALAIVMIDNPLCAATGYRICNDCMNSCIYQNQEPVNVPIIETKLLDDVLNLPYGFEIYSLLSRWNPLNFYRPFPKKNTGKNILVVGLGPSGFNLAHHLLNDGHNVIAIDGLKIEPLVDNFNLIKNFKYEKLSKRIVNGFGGVAEYGITSRWNKNYLKIIRFLLERRKNFASYGGIRFGSTITVDDAFNLGFDHIALALGSGKPKIIKIKNMLARGVRMASDFLMSLQLNSAFKFNSISNLEIRMPIVIIGCGLTAIDVATEALAYYPIQVEKFLTRYEILVNEYGKKYVEKDWTEEDHIIMNDFILHAKLIRNEKKIAKRENREAKILELMQDLGGVKVIYRKELNNSSSYKLNSYEIQNALSEGIYFIENLDPVEILTDKYNYVESIKFIDTKSHQYRYIKARCVFIALGTEPNVSIINEDKKHFKLNNIGYFTHLNSFGKEIDPIFSPKIENKDRIFVYKNGNKAISFFGDLHSSYRGSVVKAMASAKNGYPIISNLLNNENDSKIINKTSFLSRKKKYSKNKQFFNKIKKQFTAKIIKVKCLNDKSVEIVVKAPLAAKNFKIGQFFKLQTFEFNDKNSRKLTMEAIAVRAVKVNKKIGTISSIIFEKGGSTNLCRYLKKGEKIIFMGPTGSSSKIY